MLNRVKTGRVSPYIGIVVGGFSIVCIVLVILWGYFSKGVKTPEKKAQESSYDVNSNLKYADGVLSNLKALSEAPKIKVAPKTYDVKDAFSTESKPNPDKSDITSAYLNTEDFSREYIKYRENGNLLDRDSGTQVVNRTEDIPVTYQKNNEKTKKTLSEDYKRALTAPTKISLSFNHDGSRGDSGNAPVTDNHKGSDPFYDTDRKDGSFDRSEQTLDKYSVLERDNFELQDEVTDPKSPFALMQGTVISAVLSSGINSELPGQVSALVTRDVKDSIRGRFLLIPKGSKLLGQYGSTAAFGSQRLFLGFNRIIFPNGQSINIGSMPGQSQDGFSGFDADVDNHYFRILSNCLLLSSITTASASVQQGYKAQNGFEMVYTSQARELSSNVAEALGRVIERNINLAPTLKVKAGYKFTISLTKDIFFKHPYGVSNEFLIK